MQADAFYIIHKALELPKKTYGSESCYTHGVDIVHAHQVAEIGQRRLCCEAFRNGGVCDAEDNDDKTATATAAVESVASFSELERQPFGKLFPSTQ